ncbi:hypothetical protein R6Q57_022496 [Mikania cordata]
MSNQHQVTSHHEVLGVVAYPPPMDRQAPPIGYPMKDATNPQSSQARVNTRSKGDGFWKGCCAALCCCCLLDACCF